MFIQERLGCGGFRRPWRIGGRRGFLLRLPLQGVGGKVQMCELMPRLNAARSQALLAAAAFKTNRIELAQWLRRRAQLLAEPQEIAAGLPGLEEIFRLPG